MLKKKPYTNFATILELVKQFQLNSKCELN